MISFRVINQNKGNIVEMIMAQSYRALIPAVFESSQLLLI